MSKTVIINVYAKRGKQLELKQAVTELTADMQSKYSRFIFTETGDDGSYIFKGSFKTKTELKNTLSTEEFFILTGSFRALCDHIEVVLNDESLITFISRCINIEKKDVVYRAV